MRSLCVLLALLVSGPLAAQAPDPTDILARNAGYESAVQLREQDPRFSFARFSEGFNRGIRGDSSEIAYALGLRAGLGLRADTVSSINADVFLNGFRDGLSGVAPPVFAVGDCSSHRGVSRLAPDPSVARPSFL